MKKKVIIHQLALQAHRGRTVALIALQLSHNQLNIPSKIDCVEIHINEFYQEWKIPQTV